MKKFFHWTLKVTVILGTLWIPSIAAAQSDIEAIPLTHYYDTDRGIWLVDTDGDGIVDLTETLEGTDPLDPEAFRGPKPKKENLEPFTEKVGFPTSSCRSGFRQIGTRLCISPDEESALRSYDASLFCRDKRSRVCTYEDLHYLYQRSTLDSSYNPRNILLGDIQSDDIVLCGNRDITFNGDPDRVNFEGNCLKTTARQFYCCHDRE